MPKMRVHELAKLLDKSSKEIIAELKQQGFEQVEQIYEQIMKKGGIRKESRWDI